MNAKIASFFDHVVSSQGRFKIPRRRNSQNQLPRDKLNMVMTSIWTHPQFELIVTALNIAIQFQCLENCYPLIYVYTGKSIITRKLDTVD